MHFILSFIFLTTPLMAQWDLDTGMLMYSDDDQQTLVESIAGTFTTKRLFKEPGMASSLNLGLSLKQTTSENKELIKQIEGSSITNTKTETQLNEYSLNASFDQGLGVGKNMGINIGYGASDIGSSLWLGVNYSHWWLSETLQTTYSLSHTSVSQQDYTTVDVDGLQINIPDKVSGISTGVDLYHLTTPQLILRGGYRMSTRSDRPASHAINAESRYFIKKTQSALHLKGSYYQNTGELTDETLTGEVNAYSGAGEWHQRFLQKWIAMLGYRYYFEKETPRAAEGSIKQVGSDYIYGSLRWRYAKNIRWTDPRSPEISIFAGSYTSNEPNTGIITGLGYKTPL